MILLHLIKYSFPCIVFWKSSFSGFVLFLETIREMDTNTYTENKVREH